MGRGNNSGDYFIILFCAGYKKNLQELEAGKLEGSFNPVSSLTEEFEEILEK